MLSLGSNNELKHTDVLALFVIKIYNSFYPLFLVLHTWKIMLPFVYSTKVCFSLLYWNQYSSFVL